MTSHDPVLTGMVAMAHLTENTLYYARLWVMEGEGECFNALREGSTTDARLAELLRGLDRAREVYLAKRVVEKASNSRPAGLTTPAPWIHEQKVNDPIVGWSLFAMS